MKNNDELDLAVLKVAMLISGLDGHVDESEYEMFRQLAGSCHLVSGDDVLTALSDSRRRAEKIARMARESPDERKLLKAFENEASKVCDWLELVEYPSMLRRAFSMWTAMAMADGDFCSIERKGIECLRQKVNALPRLGDDFVAKAERTIEELKATSAKLGKCKSCSQMITLRSRVEELLQALE